VKIFRRGGTHSIGESLKEERRRSGVDVRTGVDARRILLKVA
jgi:phytoene dehydrogenase-like protein